MNEYKSKWISHKCVYSGKKKKCYEKYLGYEPLTTTDAFLFLYTGRHLLSFVFSQCNRIQDAMKV